MALDGLLLHQISSELKEYLPCKISKIQNISDVELLWTLRTTKGNRRLLTSFHSTYNRLHLTQASYTTMETPSNFVMLLRKQLALTACCASMWKRAMSWAICTCARSMRS